MGQPLPQGLELLPPDLAGVSASSSSSSWVSSCLHLALHLPTTFYHSRLAASGEFIYSDVLLQVCSNNSSCHLRMCSDG